MQRKCFAFAIGVLLSCGFAQAGTWVRASDLESCLQLAVPVISPGAIVQWSLLQATCGGDFGPTARVRLYLVNDWDGHHSDIPMAGTNTATASYTYAWRWDPQGGAPPINSTNEAIQVYRTHNSFLWLHAGPGGAAAGAVGGGEPGVPLLAGDTSTGFISPTSHCSFIGGATVNCNFNFAGMILVPLAAGGPAPGPGPGPGGPDPGIDIQPVVLPRPAGSVVAGTLTSNVQVHCEKFGDSICQTLDESQLVLPQLVWTPLN